MNSRLPIPYSSIISKDVNFLISLKSKNKNTLFPVVSEMRLLKPKSRFSNCKGMNYSTNWITHLLGYLLLKWRTGLGKIRKWKLKWEHWEYLDEPVNIEPLNSDEFFLTAEAILPPLSEEVNPALPEESIMVSTEVISS